MHIVRSGRLSAWLLEGFYTKPGSRGPPTFTFSDVESNLSNSEGNAYGAKSWVDEMQSCKRLFKSCAVMPYGSFGGGLNVIGK